MIDPEVAALVVAPVVWVVAWRRHPEAFRRFWRAFPLRRKPASTAPADPSTVRQPRAVCHRGVLPVPVDVTHPQVAWLPKRVETVAWLCGECGELVPEPDPHGPRKPTPAEAALARRKPGPKRAPMPAPGTPLQALRAALHDKRAEVDALAQGFATDGRGAFEVSAQQYDAYTRAVGEAQEVKAMIDALENRLLMPEAVPAPMLGPVGPPGVTGPPGVRPLLAPLLVGTSDAERSATGKPATRLHFENRQVTPAQAALLSSGTLTPNERRGLLVGDWNLGERA